ncbi:MAG: hypothetical protein WDN06_05985 [Asticcacaulis sp.]
MKISATKTEAFSYDWTIRVLSAVIVSLIAASLLICVLFGSAGPAFAAAPRAAPVTLTIKIFREERSTAADGTTSVKLVPAAKAVPGDRLVYVLTYANTGARPVANLVVDYPMPQGVSYRSAAEGSLPPLVSSDGVHFGLPGQAAGGSRTTLPQKPEMTMLPLCAGRSVARSHPALKGKFRSRRRLTDPTQLAERHFRL